MPEGPATMEGWLSGHPYLQPLATFHATVDAAMADVAGTAPGAPDWEDYRNDYLAGIPLLRSEYVRIDLDPADALIAALIERLPAAAPARDAFRGRSAAAWLLGEDASSAPSSGLLRYLGWTAMARYLRPILEAFSAWRDEDRWMRRYCPACGSLPAMAHLLGAESGRQRFLSCGSCRTRWRYRRTECPFCETDAERLPVVTIEGERGLRIDSCDSCHAYLKTYDGRGDEALLLADWTSLHLDVLAIERGLTRAAASLYELPARASAPSPS